MSLHAKPGEIVRNKKTREVYLVIGKSAQGLMVVNLLLRTDPAPIHIILPRAQDNFEADVEIIDMTKDEAIVLQTKLKDVESIQEVLNKMDLLEENG